MKFSEYISENLIGQAIQFKFKKEDIENYDAAPSDAIDTALALVNYGDLKNNIILNSFVGSADKVSINFKIKYGKTFHVDVEDRRVFITCGESEIAQFKDVLQACKYIERSMK